MINSYRSAKLYFIFICFLGLVISILYHANIETIIKGYYREGILFSKNHYYEQSFHLCGKNSIKWIKQIEKEDLNLTSRTWVPTDTSTNISLFSAFYDVDDNNLTLIRIIGAGLTKEKHKVACVIQLFDNLTCFENRPATVVIMPDHHGKRYGSLFVDCYVPEYWKPYAVSVIGTDRTRLKNRVLIKYPEPFRYNITVCLSCIHSKFNKDVETVQSIEMDQILGAEHFVVYKFSVGPKVQKTFYHYSSRDLLEVIDWNLPDISIHYYGQMVAINDCIYSNRGKSEYVIVKDFDEVIVPYRDKNLQTLTNRLAGRKSSVASINFRHSFFQRGWSIDVENYNGSLRAKQLGLHFLLNVWREKYIWKPKQRTKAIHQPERIRLSGIHFAWKMRKGFREIEVDTKEGLVHHYRYWKIDKRKGKLKNDFLRIYSDSLIKRCNKTLNIIHSK